MVANAESLIGKKITEVKMGKDDNSVIFALEDGTEFVVERYGHPGIHYDWDESLRVVVNGKQCVV